MEKQRRNISTTLSSSRNSADLEAEVISVPACRIPGASEVKKKQKTRPQISTSTRSTTAPTSMSSVLSSKLRMLTWNIGSLTGKSKEIADVMRRRNIEIACLQETKWQNTNVNKCRYLESDNDEYKLYYYGKTSQRNGVGIVLHKKYHEGVIKIVGINDRVLQIKLVLKNEIYNIISAYAPQTGCDNTEKAEFYEKLEEVLENIPSNELILIGADFNAHVGKVADGYEQCHGGFGYGTRNDPGEQLLTLANAYNLKLANTYFRKKDEHLITFKSGTGKTQIDFWLCSADIIRMSKDCKVIPGESVTSQHRLLLLELKVTATITAKKDCIKPVSKIKWFKLPKNEGRVLVTDMNKWFDEHLEKVKNLNANDMWNEMEKFCVEKAKLQLGISKGKLKIKKESWWWNETVKAAVKKKKEAFKQWSTCREDALKEQLKIEYKQRKNEAKRLVAKAQDEAKEDLYSELLNPEGAQKIYKIAAHRMEKAKSIRTPKYINNAQGVLITKESEICDRWKQYYSDLLNEEFPRQNLTSQPKRHGPIQDVTVDEVHSAVQKMKNNRAVGPDNIPAELWKECSKTSESGTRWLMVLMNKILEGDPMPEKFRNSYTLPFYKNKGDSRECGNYRGISLMCHTIKIYERIIERRLRTIVKINDNQCGFVSGKSTVDAIQTLRILVEKYHDAKKDLHMVFIDLEKAFDRVPRELIYESLRAHDVPEAYNVELIRDMYHKVTKQIRCSSGLTSSFPIQVGVHQGSVLSPLLFIIILNHLIADRINNLTKILLFADDIAMIGENEIVLEYELEEWRKILEENGLRISRKKTEYMHLPFKDPPNPAPKIMLQGEELPRCEKFKYLGLVVSSDGQCTDDVNSRIQTGWLKFRSLTGVLCDRKMPIKVKGNVYKTMVRPALLYGSECWTMYNTFEKKIQVTEMRMLRMSAVVTLRDRIRSKYIRGSLGVTDIKEKIEERQLRWYGHIQRRPDNHMVKEAMKISFNLDKQRGRPRNNWIRQQENRLKKNNIPERDIQNRRQYHLRTRRADPSSHN